MTEKNLNVGKHMIYVEWYSGDVGGLFMKINRNVYTAQTPYQRIDIFDSPFYGRVFALDGITMITERDEFMYHEMLVHVPMFVHPNPKKSARHRWWRWWKYQRDSETSVS